MDHIEFRIDITKKEIDLINTKINHFDNLRLRTKQMAIILWTATVGFGLKESIPILFLISVLLPIPFWLMEAKYRKYYKGFRLRLWAIWDLFRNGKYDVRGEIEVNIEQFLNDKECEFPLFDLWGNDTINVGSFKKETNTFRNFMDRGLVLIYGSMALISLILLYIQLLK